MKRPMILVLLMTAVLSTACASRTINQVLADPGQYRNKEVKLTGAVVDSYSLVGRGAYRIDDRDVPHGRARRTRSVIEHDTRAGHAGP